MTVAIVLLWDIVSNMIVSLKAACGQVDVVKVTVHADKNGWV